MSLERFLCKRDCCCSFQNFGFTVIVVLLLFANYSGNGSGQILGFRASWFQSRRSSTPSTAMYCFHRNTTEPTVSLKYEELSELALITYTMPKAPGCSPISSSKFCKIPRGLHPKLLYEKSNSRAKIKYMRSTPKCNTVCSGLNLVKIMNN